jgi:oxygenase catalysing oxidative methylation of damaged DNA
MLIEGAPVAFYERLALVANRWAGLLSGENPTFPWTHDLLLARWQAAGQTRPTPLISVITRVTGTPASGSLSRRVLPISGFDRALRSRIRLRRRGVPLAGDQAFGRHRTLARRVRIATSIAKVRVSALGACQ